MLFFKHQLIAGVNDFLLFWRYFLIKFAQKLKETRVEKSITQKAVADYLGIKETSYQYYEYGKREPNYETLAKLSELFNLSTDYLLGITDNPEKL